MYPDNGVDKSRRMYGNENYKHPIIIIDKTITRGL
jgi:hypothetical protein